MSRSNWRALIGSTALLTLMVTGAYAGDAYMVQLAPPTVANTAADSNLKSATIADPADTTPKDQTSPALTVSNEAPEASPASPNAPAVTAAQSGESAPAPSAPSTVAATPAAAGEDVASKTENAKETQAPDPVAVMPAVPETAASVPAMAGLETPSDETAAAVAAASQTASDASGLTTSEQGQAGLTTGAVATAGAVAAQPVIAVESAKINRLSVDTQEPVSINKNAVNPGPISAPATVGSLAATTPAQPAESVPSVTTAPAEPMLVPASAAVAVPAQPNAQPATVPAAAPPAGVTADALAAALKSEIEIHFSGKASDDRKLSAEERKSRGAIIAFYGAHAFAPLWVDGTGFAAAAKSAMDRLSRANEDGLNPADYPIPTLGREPTAEALAKAEVALTESALKYARQAQAGRFDPIRLSDLVTAKPTIPDPDGVLKTLASASNVSVALEAYNPPQEGYKRLKAKLAEIEPGKLPAPVARVPDGPTIRPGQHDTRVALLRNRLGMSGGATVDDAATYDDALVDAVKSFQKTRGLKPSGVIGQQTLDAVNEDVPGTDSRAADIIANMERWRWLPRDLGDLYVMVNIPDFALAVVHHGVAIHRAKAIVGRVANPTPVFSDTMTHIIVNPYWNVPYSIVKKEYLGKAQETKGEALTRGNFEVEVGNQTVDPTTVDWTTVNAADVHLRQRPGEGNALGNIKFMFPNQHSVYIHDTSSRGLFVQSYRSLSHGCVRVQDPFAFADALMVEEPTGITGAKLKAMIGGGEKYLWLKKTIPVHITYFNDFVDDAGNLQTRPDLYGHNARTKQLLGL